MVSPGCRRLHPSRMGEVQSANDTHLNRQVAMLARGRIACVNSRLNDPATVRAGLFTHHDAMRVGCMIVCPSGGYRGLEGIDAVMFYDA